MKQVKIKMKKKSRGASRPCLNNSYLSADEEIFVVSLISVYCVGLHSVF